MALLIASPEATPEVLARACVLVIFGGIFDLLDGRVARMTGRFSEFGVQLDSIADIVGPQVTRADCLPGKKQGDMFEKRLPYRIHLLVGHRL